ncbi:ZIP family metal transporter [Corticibacter populi]|uniref:ZIP family metal transporter n=1 Tax=Corticibacter populi TaxID=1550736 RepID=A0A3M6QKH5_9BURK|nr:ZIP family metal transporter [Corticibacter populi]RZS33368.1 zinc and cadmium transporter [Corticibacter populi]
MTFFYILLATLVAGVGSVWLAASLIRFGVGGASSRLQGHHLLSFAAGALLATAFVHLLPEAMESSISKHTLFMALLIGLVVFFLLDKAELWHHGHEHAESVAIDHADHVHAGAAQAHGHSHAHTPHVHAHGHRAPIGGWTILAGDSVHCFGDGVLIASAFIVDWRIGLLTALSVLAHEVPHHIGDLIVLAETVRGRHSERRSAALLKVSVAGSVTMLGGLAGYLLLGQLSERWLPFFLVVASSSFIYVALADLIPQLQMQLGARQALVQVAWLLAGMLLVGVVSHALQHEHAHPHGAADAHVHEHVHSAEEEALSSPPGFGRQHPLHIDNLRPLPRPAGQP